MPEAHMLSAAKSHLKFIIYLSFFGLALVINAGHFLDNENTYPPLLKSDFQLESDDAETEKHKKLIKQRRTEFLIQFSRDNPALVQFKAASFREIEFLFKFRFTGSRGRACSASFSEKPFSLVMDINGTQYRHQSELKKIAIVTHKISNDDRVTFYFDAQENDCGAAHITLAKKGAYPNSSFILVFALWAIFISICYASGRIAVPFYALLVHLILSEAELRIADYVSLESFIAVALVPLLSALTVAFVSSIRSRIAGIPGLLVLVVSILFTLAVIVFPMVVIGFDKIFNKAMDKYDWYAIYQTDIPETSEFLLVFAPTGVMVGFFGIFAVLFLVCNFCRFRSLNIPILASIIAAPLLGAAAMTLLAQTVSVSLAMKSFQTYSNSVTVLKEKLKARANLQFGNSISAEKKEQGELYIVVLGESANKFHFSLYNYPRKTSPKMDKRRERGELVIQENAYAGGVSTIGTLQYALTSSHLEAELTPSESPSIIEVLNRAGVETYWIHVGSTAVRKSILSVIAEQAYFRDTLSRRFGREDGKVIREVEKIMERGRPATKVIFLKTQGSHIKYCDRIEHDFESWRFTDREYDRWLWPVKYPPTSISKSSDCYDGTIKYTDHVVDELIKLVENNPEPSALLYFSDHGEDIIRGTAHMQNLGYDVFSIPMFTYFSPQYREKYPHRVSSMERNANRVFVNDQMYDTVLGIAGVNTSAKDDKNDLSSAEFESHDKIFRGKKSVYDSDNYEFRTRNRISELMATQEANDLKIFLGGIAHPFHLAYVNGSLGYPLASFEVYEEDEQLWMNALSYYPLAFSTAVQYIDLSKSRKIFVKFTLAENSSENAEVSAQKVVDALSELNCKDPCQLIISTENISVARALKRLGQRVSLLVGPQTTDSEIGEFDSVAVTEIDLPTVARRIGHKHVTLVDPSCDFLSCDPAEVEYRLKQEYGSNPVDRVIAPVHDL